MTSISTRRRLAALLLLPFLLVLAGCGKFHADMEIQDVDTINVSYDFAVDAEFLEGIYDSAEDLCTDAQGELGVSGEAAPTVEPYEEGGQLGCRVTGVMSSDNFGTGVELTEQDGEFHLVMSSGEEVDDVTGGMGAGGLGIDFRMTFTFPGAIIESSGGQIDGNSVTFTDIDEFAQGVDIRAEAGGFPWIVVVLVVLVLGFLLLLLLAAVAFFVIRARRGKGGSGPAGMPGGYSGATAVPPAGPASPAAPQGPQWGQASPPPAPQPGGQQWAQPGGPQDQAGRPWDRPGEDGRPPQPPSW